MKRKLELNEQSTRPEKKQKIDHKDLIAMMQENNITEIIQFIKSSRNNQEELKKVIVFAHYQPNQPILTIIKQMNLLNFAIYHGSTELLDTLIENGIIQPSWLKGSGLNFDHPLTLAIIMNKRIFLNNFLAKIQISSEEMLRSFMEAVKFNKTRFVVMRDFPNFDNTQDYINDTIKWILNLHPLKTFNELYIDKNRYLQEDIEKFRSNFDKVKLFRNNIFMMFKACQFDEGSLSSKLNIDCLREIHKNGF